jgi:hypothetical protein
LNRRRECRSGQRSDDAALAAPARRRLAGPPFARVRLEAAFSETTGQDGRIQQSVFNRHPVARVRTSAACTSGRPRDDPPGGVGEPGAPPLAPARTTAIVTASSTRTLELPVATYDLSA